MIHKLGAMEGVNIYLYSFHTLIAQPGLGANCSVPCHRVLYDPSLSYSQLSKNNIERAIFGASDPTERIAEIQSTFLESKETTSRYVKSIYQRDSQIFADVAEQTRALVSLLNSSSRIMASSAALASHLGIGDVIGDINPVLESVWMRDTFTDYGPNDLFKDAGYRMTFKFNIMQLITNFEGLYSFYEKVRYKLPTSVANDFSSCVSGADMDLVTGYLNNTYSYVGGTYLIPHNRSLPRSSVAKRVPPGSITPSGNTKTCLDNIDIVIGKCQYLVDNVPISSNIQEQYGIYLQAIDEIYTNTWVDPEVASLGCHGTCAERLRMFNVSEAEAFVNAYQLVTGFVNVTQPNLTYIEFYRHCSPTGDIGGQTAETIRYPNNH